MSIAPSRQQGSSKISWALSALPALMLASSTVFKLQASEKMVGDWTGKFGFPASTLLPVGLLELTCLVVYLIPRTAVLGAVLLTGYFGGAIVTHLRVGELPMMINPFVLGGLAWLGLYLREPRLRALLPLRQEAAAEAGKGRSDVGAAA